MSLSPTGQNDFRVRDRLQHIEGFRVRDRLCCST